MTTFITRRLEQELAKFTNEELLELLHQGFGEYAECSNEIGDPEAVATRNTILAIGQELERRGVKGCKRTL